MLLWSACHELAKWQNWQLFPHFSEFIQNYKKNTLYQVNDDIFAKLSSPFCCNFADMHNSFWIISVYMKNRRIYNLMKKETIEQTTRNKFIQEVI